MKITKSHSIRDPNGQIFRVDDKIYRRVAAPFVPEFQTVRKTGLIDQFIQQKKLLPEIIINPTTLVALNPNDILLEHPTLPFISYPYEWTFSALKQAALFHLDMLINALEQDVTLCDSSSYNIQYQGSEPVFIDHLSFRPYQENQFWMGHRQFMQEFLNPLLLTAWCGIPFQSIYRGQLTGISNNELYRLLPWHKKIRPRSFLHLSLPALLEKQSGNTSALPAVFSKKTFQKLLNNLIKWIEPLSVNYGKTAWQHYSATPSFNNEQLEFKQKRVAEFVMKHKPLLLADLGCNQGQYAELALQQGAKQVIGFDSDQNALEQAFKISHHKKLNFTPLYMDLSNPSPNQGFGQEERLGLTERANFNAVLALAVIHHLALGQNIPLTHLCDWIIKLAPAGLIEFVPKSDPMAKEILRLKGDIFPEYSLENFLKILESMAKVNRVHLIPGTERYLIEYS